jgi:hypothetical protein
MRSAQQRGAVDQIGGGRSSAYNSDMADTHLLALAVGFAVCAGNAYAADPNSIFGRWIEKLPNRTGIVTEFKPQSIESYSVDRAGHRVKEVGNFSVSYLNLSLSTIGVVFPGGGRSILILVKSRDTIVLDFPGMGAHTLKRLSSR